MVQRVKLYFRHCTIKGSKISFIRVCFFLCINAWPQYAGWQFFPHGSGGKVPRKAERIYRGLCGADGEVVYSSFEKTVENHFYKGLFFFCALAHGHSKPVCNFSSSVWGGESQGTQKKIRSGLRAPGGEVVFSSLYEETVEDHFYKGGVVFFLCTGAWPQYAGWRFYPHGFGERSQGTRKILDGEVVYSSLYEKTAENHFYDGGYFFCALVATVCPFAIFSSWV